MDLTCLEGESGHFDNYPPLVCLIVMLMDIPAV